VAQRLSAEDAKQLRVGIVREGEKQKMGYLLDATYIGIEDDGYVFVLGFADDAFAPQKYVLLQRGLEPDQSRSGYGGIASVRYRDGTLFIALTPEGKAFLAVDDEIAITLSCDEVMIARALEALPVVAKGDFPIEIEK
jgi:hypothetical protein